MTPGIALSDFAKRLDQTADDTEALLAKLLSDTLLPDAIARPKLLIEAMRYSSVGAGVGGRRYGRRPDPRPRRRGPVRRPRAGRRRAATADEDRRAFALLLHCRRHPRPILGKGTPGARRLRPRARRSFPDRRRP